MGRDVRAAMAAPRLRASKALICLKAVPTMRRSSLRSVGQLTAPGRWSSAYSSSLRASMMWENCVSRGSSSVAGRRVMGKASAQLFA